MEAPHLSKLQAGVFRVLVDDYIQFHKRNRHNATRILIFRPGRTGLGDRLTVMAFAFWAASISKRLFLVDWQDPFPLSQLLQNARADVDVFFRPAVDDPKNETIGFNPSSTLFYLNSTQKAAKEHDSALFSNLKTVVLEISYRTNLTWALIDKIFPPNVRLSYVNQVAATIPFYRVIYHRIFMLSAEMLEYQKQLSHRMRIRPTYPEHFQTFPADSSSKVTAGKGERVAQNARPYIAVHARVGAGVGEAHDGFRFAEISRNMKSGAMCLASRAVKLAHMSGHPPLPIYLATDTPAFRGVFRQVVGNFSHGSVEVVGGDWDALHTNAFELSGRPQRSLPTPKQKKALRDVCIDFVMLGHGEHIVSLYSSFPRLAQGVGTARTLTEIRNEICFKVDKWM
ncbi:unnamed protein product [Agarophyton chilense]